MKKLPIGKQSFASLRMDDDMVYIDKTKYILSLVQNRAPYFLSRPRRFGKSLLIDTIRCLFEGKKELFEGLYIYDQWDWKVKYPVVKIVFGEGFIDSKEKLRENVHKNLDEVYEEYGIESAYTSIDLRFSDLIKKLYKKTGRQVVVLVDEYDKPILDMINKIDIAGEIKDELKGFYSVLKWADEYLKFVMLTGVTKFSKVSLFSGLNNLQDITLNAQYNAICGYTLTEIIDNFWPEGYLEWVDLDKMRVYYNGYSFWNTSETLYNPFWLLNFFWNSNIYNNYWFSSATPTFLMKLINERLDEFRLTDLENLEVGNEILDSFDVDKINLRTLLFQTGYLTIKSMQKLGSRTTYTLGIPNEEVRSSLNDYLIQDYLLFSDYDFKMDKLKKLHKCLSTWDVDSYVSTVKEIFAGIPYSNYTKNKLSSYEWFYGSVLYAFMAYTGIEFIAEDFTNRGRIDFTLKYGKYIYIIELKVEEKWGKALAQIQEKKYYEKYQGGDNEIYLIGFNFDTGLRNIGDYEVEKI